MQKGGDREEDGEEEVGQRMERSSRSSDGIFQSADYGFSPAPTKDRLSLRLKIATDLGKADLRTSTVSTPRKQETLTFDGPGWGLGWFMRSDGGLHEGLGTVPW
jgi:hypothetical protein